MCTLIVSFRPGEDFPLVVAANRDERLDRAASPPRLWSAPLPFIAPRDEVGGGSWLGLNREGLFVAITNRFGAAPDPARESRGTLVLEALGHPDAGSLHRAMAALPARRFNAFHLLYANSQEAFVSWSDGEVLRQAKVGAGLQVVTERSLGGDDRARVELIEERWRELEKKGSPAALDLQALLSIHREDVLGGTCLHAPTFNFGTRSSMVLRLSKELSRSELRWADGPPCRTRFVELPGLVGELFGASRRPD